MCIVTIATEIAELPIINGALVYLFGTRMLPRTIKADIHREHVRYLLEGQRYSDTVFARSVRTHARAIGVR